MTSTAADRRLGGHLRGESIAQKRTRTGAGAADDSPQARINIGGGAGGEGFGPRASAQAFSAGGGPAAGRFSIPPRTAVRLIGGCLALFLLLHYVPAYFASNSSQNIAAQAQHRKSLMAGAGESWILPRKWRDVHAGEGDVTLNGETLPECKRVLLFRFSGTHGFSSEMIHYLRAGVVAQKLGYTLLADDSEFNYGSLTDYFLPRPVFCRPPEDWFSTEAATRLGARRWQGQDRVWVSREIEGGMDEWIRDEMLEPSAVAELRARKHGWILPEGESLPAAFVEVFQDYRTVLKDVWRPNAQRLELGLGGGGLRHRKHSPTFGGNRRLGSVAGADSAGSQNDGQEEDEDEWEYDVAERSDRGPVVGVHLAGRRPGMDLSAYGILPEAGRGLLEAVYEGADDAVRRLTHASVKAPGYSRARPNLFRETATPTLIALTSNETLFAQMTASPAAELYNVLRTSPPPFEELRPFNDVLRLDVGAYDAPKSAAPSPGAAAAAAKGSINKLLREWDQQVWNQDVPRELRVLLTRYFLRDLIVLSQHADAFVVSGASPTGRLAMLLSGEDGAIGPRDLNGGSYGGRVRSIDGFWVPTARASSVFG
ncbi:hypothetical protein JCM8202v2_003169 [Rhodotorula sphaerocarpa]